MSNFKVVFRTLHIILAIIGISITAIFATSTTGHPPGIVFTPIVVGLWAVGHLLLWLSKKLALQGTQLAENGEGAEGAWPLTLVLLAFVFGCVFVFGLFGIIFKILFENNWQSKLPSMLIIWLLPSICFVGILLRQAWSRILASGGFVVAALFLLYQMIESAVRGNRVTALEWAIAVVILLVFLFLGQHIFRSSRIKAFYAN